MSVTCCSLHILLDKSKSSILALYLVFLLHQTTWQVSIYLYRKDSSCSSSTTTTRQLFFFFLELLLAAPPPPLSTRPPSVHRPARRVQVYLSLTVVHVAPSCDRMAKCSLGGGSNGKVPPSTFRLRLGRLGSSFQAHLSLEPNCHMIRDQLNVPSPCCLPIYFNLESARTAATPFFKGFRCPRDDSAALAQFIQITPMAFEGHLRS